MLIALVRHGSAGRRGSGPRDRLRPLDAAGTGQARALVSRLGTLPLSRVMSSPYPRCVQTVEPLAAARGLTVEKLDLLAEGHSAQEVLALMASLDLDGAALCSHGDVIGALVGTLQRAGVIKAGAPPWEKGSTWILQLEGGRVTGARYLPPGLPSG